MASVKEHGPQPTEDVNRSSNRTVKEDDDDRMGMVLKRLFSISCFIFLFSETRLFRLNINEQHNIQQCQNPTSFGMGYVTLSASASRDLLLLVRHQGTVTLLCHAARRTG